MSKPDPDPFANAKRLARAARASRFKLETARYDPKASPLGWEAPPEAKAEPESQDGPRRPRRKPF